MHINKMTIVRLKSLGCCQNRLRTGEVQTTRTTILIGPNYKNHHFDQFFWMAFKHVYIVIILKKV